MTTFKPVLTGTLLVLALTGAAVARIAPDQSTGSPADPMTPAEAGPDTAAVPLLLADSDEYGEREWGEGREGFWRIFGRHDEHHGEHDRHHGREDDDDDDGAGPRPAPAGSTTPPANGLFNGGAAPQAQVK